MKAMMETYTLSLCHRDTSFPVMILADVYMSVVRSILLNDPRRFARAFGESLGGLPANLRIEL